jgi:hypothetical protein
MISGTLFARKYIVDNLGAIMNFNDYEIGDSYCLIKLASRARGIGCSANLYENTSLDC